MKRILFFLIGMLAAVNMQADVVEGYEYQGMTFSYDTDTHYATLTDGKSIVSSKVVIPGSFAEGGNTYTVTSIGANAFKGNTNDINHVIIPEEVTTIGESAFDGCNQIKLIELPSNLSNIGNKAFNGCSRLVHVSCKVTNTSTLSPNIFPNNTLMTLYVPQNLLESYKNDNNWKAKFGDRIYGGNMILASAGGMTYVCADGSGKEASLYAASDASDITVPSTFTFDENTYSVKTIGRSVFYGFTILNSLVIEEGIETICDMALQNCSNLKKLVIPSSLKTMGTDILKNCNSLIHIWCKVEDATILDATKFPKKDMMTLYVPNAHNYMNYGSWNTQFNGRIFEGEMIEVKDAKDMTYICATTSQVATLFVGKNESDVVVPSTVSEYTVTGIDRQAFNGFSSLVNLTVSENVSMIGPEAFKGCTNLKTLKLPATLTQIMSNAFNGCNNLARVQCNAAPFGINDNVFSSAKYLFVPSNKRNDYQLTDGWKKFAYTMEGDMMDVYEENTHFICATASKEAIIIQGDKEASGVNVPSSVLYNGVYYDVKVIDGYAYSGAKVITLTIDGPQELCIENKAFEKCSNLRTLFLPRYLQKLGSQAFTGCNNLVHIVCTSFSPFNISNDVFSTTTATLYVPVNNKSAYASCTGWGSFTNIIECDDMEEVSQDGMTYVCLRIGYSRTATLTKGVSTISDVTIPNTVKGLKSSYINEEIVTDYQVTAVAESAFSGFKSLANLTLSEGIASIGANAFYNCTGLKKVVLPSSLTAIGNEAFFGCSSLTDIVCKMESPAGFTGSVFSNTSATVYVPAGKTEIYKATSGWSNFANMVEGDRVEETHENITYVYASGGTTATLIKGNTTDADLVIPSVVPGTTMKVTAIDKSAFNSNSSLVNLTIPEGVVTIGAYAFQKCSNLKTVVLPSTLTSIGDYAFDQCKKIETMTSGIPATKLFVINENVFSSDIWPITAVYVPIGDADTYKAKDGWKKFTNYYEGERSQITINKMTYEYLTGTKTATLIGTTSEDNDITIPGTFLIDKDTYTVTAIANSAFKGKTSLVNLKISENVKTIGTNAFQGCSNLKKIEFPSTLTSIGEKAFDGCKNITHICSLVKVPFEFLLNVFSSYTASLYVPEGSKDSYKSTNYWGQFSNVVEGYFVNEIISEDLTFDLMSTGSGESLKETAILTKSATTTPTVSIPSTIDRFKVTMIGPSSFSGNSKLVNLIIPANVQTIGDNAFNGCNNIVNIISKIENPTDISDNVFSTSSASLYVPKGTRDLYKSKNGWSRFTTVYEGEMGEKTVGDLSFVYATADKTAMLVGTTTTATDVVVPDSFAVNDVYYYVTAIDKSVFKGKTSVVNLILPSKLTQIGDDAFNGCKNIATITCKSIEPPVISDNVFPAYIATLYVPEGFRSKYQGAKGWRNFSTILEGERNETTTEDGMTYIYATGDKTATLIKAAVSDKDVVVAGTFKLGDVTYTVTAIDNSVFKGNKSIVNLKIAENIRTIGANAFLSCVNLEKVELPSTVTAIGENAFSGCTRLSHIVSRIKAPFPINDNVFAESIYPTAMLYVPTVTSADYKNTTGWKNFTQILVGEMKEVTINDLTYYCVQGPNIATLVKASTAAADITIPAMVQDGDVTYQVTGVGAYAFSGIGSLENITITEGITTIGIGAFQNCSKLAKVVLPSTWTSIGDYAFDKCTRLSLIISNNKNPIGISDVVFSAYTAKVNVPVGTTELYRYAGSWGNFEIFLEGDMKEVLAGDITYLCVAGSRTAVLTKCSSKSKEITVPTSISDEGVEYAVVTIDESAFANNSSLVNLMISDGVKTIRNKAFSNCSYLNKVILPSTLTSIGNYAFEKCNRLSNIECYMQKPLAISENVFTTSTISNAMLCVPDKTKELYASADVWKDFNSIIEGEMQEAEVDGMTYICVPNQKWAKLIKGNSKAKEVTVPSSITIDNINCHVNEIDRYAFAGFNSLESVTLSEGIQIIGETAFQNCYKLNKVVLPSSLTVFGSKAFEKCSRLQEVYYYGEDPVALADDVFPLSDVTLYVLISSIGKYQAAQTWNQFKSIVGLEAITISSAGQLTYASAFDLDFSNKNDLKAYVATGYDKKTGTIWLTRVKEVPAGTGFLLMGEAGKYGIPVMHGGSTSYYMNLFRGTLEAMTLQTTDGTNTNYYLSNGDAGVGFYKVTKEGGVSLAAHRAYLSVPTDIPAVGSAGGTETIKVSSAGQVPYCNSQSLDFGALASQGVRAYTATGYNYSTGTIWLTRVMQVPAETGILIIAPEGEYPVPTASVATVYANMFKGTLEGTTIQTHETIAGEDYINYYLSNGDAGVGFYKVTKEGGVLLNANRCYLPILNKDTAAGTRSESSEKSQVTLEEADEVISIPLLRGIGGDEDGTTSIRNLTPALSEGEGEWYTLQGQRVTNPGKGLYIHNGKKVVIK